MTLLRVLSYHEWLVVLQAKILLIRLKLAQKLAFLIRSRSPLKVV
jgi:hypothetical protein